ncbi:MAG: hypothetical protein WBY75_07305 [Terracidiphilus sp.]
MTSDSKRRAGPGIGLGVALGVAYLLFAALLFGVTASHPDDGLEWIPFLYLTMPWSALGPSTGLSLAIAGAFINAVLIAGIVSGTQRWIFRMRRG